MRGGTAHTGGTARTGGTAALQIVPLTIEFKDEDRFNGTDYSIWSMRLTQILEENESMGLLDDSIAQPATPSKDVLTW